MHRPSHVLAVLFVALVASSAPRPATAAPAPGQVTGIVRDEQGSAVANAGVRVSPAVPVVGGGAFNPTPAVATATTDAAGRYSLAAPAGAYDLVVTAGPGSAPYTAAVRGVTIAAGAATPVDVVVVRPYVAFRGKVVDGRGSPLPAVLRLEHRAPTFATQAETTAATDGSFTLMAPRGVYNFNVRTDLGDVLLTATVPALKLTGDRTETLTFPVADVDLTVRTDDGLPAGELYLGCFDGCEPAADLFPGAGARMTFASNGRPDSQGKLRLRGFSATDARVIITDTDALRRVETHTVSLNAPGALTVSQPRIGPTVTFLGSLKDAAGKPLNGHVSLINDGFEVTAETYEYDVVEGAGEFRITAPPGRYRLDVSADVETVWDQQGVESGIYVDGLFVSLDGFELTADRTVDLTVPIADFPVTVLEADGRPAAAVRVSGISGGTDKPDRGDAVVEIFPGGVGRGRLVNEEGWTDAAGIAHLKIFPGAAPPTVHALQALTLAHKSVSRTAGAAEVRFPPRRHIQGQLRDAHGPLPGAIRVDVDETTGRPVNAIDDIWDDGTWAFTAPDGRYRVRFGYPYRDYDDHENPPNDHRPEVWWIDADLEVSRDAAIDVTLPDTAPADVFVHDTDGSPARQKLSTSATTNAASVALAPALSGRGHAASDARSVAGTGHVRAPLFGPSDVTLSIGNPWPNVAVQAKFPLSPGGQIHVALAVPGAVPATVPLGPPADEPQAPPVSPPTGGAPRSGYWVLGSDGRVYAFGNAVHLDDWTTGLGAATAVDLEPTPSGAGYWILDDRGRVRAFGDAISFADVDASGLHNGERPASLSATPSGRGYWIFTDRGRVVPFGDAGTYGDMSTVRLNGPVLDSVATPDGRGYFMVASDGGIFAFGDARFAGSMGGSKLNAPVQSLVPDGDGSGYWLVASDGGIFAFDAPFRGSLGSTPLNKPIRGMVRYGNGYLMVGEDGGVFNFSDRPFSGSLGEQPPSMPVVAVAALS